MGEQRVRRRRWQWWLVGLAIGVVLVYELYQYAEHVHDRTMPPMASSDLRSLGLALSQYYRDHGVYPPDHDAQRDKCSECLVYYLGGPSVNRSKKAPGDHLQKTYFEFSAPSLEDYDGDGWLEAVDPWGRPIIYNAGRNAGHRDLDRPQYKDGAPRHRRDSYDLYSLGPDGLTGKKADYRVLHDRPACFAKGEGKDSFYEAACNDEYDGSIAAPAKEAPGSQDDIANF